MPTRRNVVRVVTASVQGDDSYVVVRKLTVGEAREVLRDRQRRNQSAMVRMADAGQNQEIIQEAIDAEAAIENIEWAVKRFKGHIREWNWVDDDGEPLPQIKDDPDIVDQLSIDEMRVLSEALGTDQDAAKN